MDFGLVLFTSDRGITPAAAAKLADDHNFTTFYVPEHTHIPVKPDPDKLAHWKNLGVTEVLFGLPDKPADDITAYVERLAGKLATLNL